MGVTNQDREEAGFLESTANPERKAGLLLANRSQGFKVPQDWRILMQEVGEEDEC
jgi:hypothetical protein